MRPAPRQTAFDGSDKVDRDASGASWLKFFCNNAMRRALWTNTLLLGSGSEREPNRTASIVHLPPSRYEPTCMDRLATPSASRSLSLSLDRFTSVCTLICARSALYALRYALRYAPCPQCQSAAKDRRLTYEVFRGGLARCARCGIVDVGSGHTRWASRQPFCARPNLAGLIGRTFEQFLHSGIANDDGRCDAVQLIR